MAVQRFDAVGTYVNFDGTPAAGQITITPSHIVRDLADNVLLEPAPRRAVLDASGYFTIPNLITSDSPDVNPAGFTYLVTEDIQDVGRRKWRWYATLSTGPLYPATNLYPSPSLYPQHA